MFNNNAGGYSLSDIAAVAGNEGFGGNGFGGGWGVWILLLFLFAIGGWGFGGYGGYGNDRGTPQVTASMDTDYLSTGIRDLTGSVANDFYTLNTGLLNGFCDVQNSIATNTAAVTAAVTNGFNIQNLANLQNTNAIQRDIYSGTVGAMQNTQALQSTLAGMASDNRADTAALNYNLATQFCATNTANATNTRDIIDAQHEDARAILSAIQQNKVDAMQDKINDLQAQNQALNLAASQAAQNSYLLSQLNPSPVPAYPVSRSCPCNGNWGMMPTV